LLLITLPLAPPALAQPSQLDPTTTQVTAGGSHTCALTTVGGVKCWGFNGNGQLGDSSTTNRQAPVDVSGLASGVAAIAAGDNHTCALTTTGGMKCWGYNAFGQLGDGSITAWSTPVDVSGLTGGVTAITAGAIHTCALTTAGGVKCWGANFSGQLGDGSTTNRSTPVNVSGLAGGMTAIAAGYSHACAMTTASGVKCWGFNGYGQLGDGSTTDRLTPVDVSGVASGVTAIAAGDNHTCTLTTMGGVKCSGNNGNGQLGDGSTLSRLTPVDVSGLTSGVTAIAVGGLHTCALTTWGGVKCWGYNSFGQLGDGSTRDRLTPVDISGLTGGVTAITAGAIHTCALTTAGGVKCWGFNVNGQLGDGSSTNRLTPVTVGGLTSGLTSGVTAIAAGGFHTCALTPAGGVKCWGLNGSGQLGDGSTTNRLTPVAVGGLTSGVTAIATGSGHTCALTTAGGVKCWGWNGYGQLGDGSSTDRSTPVDVSGLASGVTAIAAGQTHTCALTPAGGIKCWGRNGNGQLGDGSLTNRLTPVNVSGLASGVTAIAAGGNHTCALTTAGGVKCWGWNVYGQLGDGSTTNRSTPVDVSGLASGVTAIAAGQHHACALTPAGGVKCWGNNGEGQLGDGTRTNRSIPVDVSGLASGVTAIAAGTYHTCALTPAGGVKCWGYNVYGQLGDGSNTDPLTPVDVLRGQSISFTPPILLGVGGAPVTLTATSGSGLPVSFDTWTPTTCTVSGNTVTAPAPALCGIRASQAGDGNNSAAPQRLVLVNVIATTLNVDASAVATRYHALSDGLIVMRFMRGLTGAALTAGTSVPGAAVNDPVVIASNLASMGMLLDIDGNGTIDAATDGQLIVRYMLGLRGEALIANALGTAPRARSTAVEIEAWLAALMP